MKSVVRVEGGQACAVTGSPCFDPAKAAWNGGMFLAALLLAPLYFTWGAFALFLIATYASLLIGHSVGMHRLMIHQTFECAKPLERALIYVGVLVGVAGPFGIIRIHDVRDWAQRQPSCHAFFAHTKSLPFDLLWQLAYKFQFQRAPAVRIESRFQDDKFYQFLERSWRWHQLLLAGILYFIGGWPWLIWGVCVRVFVSAAGHWTITYFCHNPGSGNWRVPGAAVQASNLRNMGLLTYGECWHNNHHAFPESARIGLYEGQADPAWWFISALQKLGLVWNVGEPRSIAERDDLLKVAPYP